MALRAGVAIAARRPAAAKPEPKAALTVAVHKSGPFSNPAAATTSKPLSRINRPLGETKRPPDRGGHTPVLGTMQRVDGRAGGTPAVLAPLRSGVENAPVPKTSQAMAQRLSKALDKEISLKRQELRPKIKVQRGLSGLVFAKSAAQRVERRAAVTGSTLPGIADKLMRRDRLFDTRLPLTRGQFAQERTVPASKLAELRDERITRDLVGTGGQKLAIPDEIGAYGVERAPTGDAIKVVEMPGATVDLGPQHDVGNAVVRGTALPTAQRGILEGTERILFIVAAGVVAWLIFRGRG